MSIFQLVLIATGIVLLWPIFADKKMKKPTWKQNIYLIIGLSLILIIIERIL
ncbi:hypothetical protein MACH08_18910 [Oceanobacillus kimchii]|uniref:Uncharacterized protein n=1 Tax=Oceanobacillus kimchii TaxID=746691 RepID=A0ABQ5TIY5_9BACI|nr:hypothetical protein MACH08_18910 [Oceanobacillus kimchii]